MLSKKEIKANKIVAAIWDTALDAQVCEACAGLHNRIFPIYSRELKKIDPPIHKGCRCRLRYVTQDERGIKERLKEYRPVDFRKLKKGIGKKRVIQETISEEQGKKKGKKGKGCLIAFIIVFLIIVVSVIIALVNEEEKEPVPTKTETQVQKETKEIQTETSMSYSRKEVYDFVISYPIYGEEAKELGYTIGSMTDLLVGILRGEGQEVDVIEGWAEPTGEKGIWRVSYVVVADGKRDKCIYIADMNKKTVEPDNQIARDLFYGE